MSENKVALVTGANKGIGKEIVRQLAHHGLRVLLGARDETRGTGAVKELISQGLNVELLIVDIESISSIQNAANKLISEVGHLDILINNAGAVYERTAPSQSDPALLRKTFETNYFGAVSVTKAMRPLLRKSDHKVIVNISSELGKGTVEQGAQIPAQCALAGPDGPTGCFLTDGGSIPW